MIETKVTCDACQKPIDDHTACFSISLAGGRDPYVVVQTHACSDACVRLVLDKVPGLLAQERVRLGYRRPTGETSKT